MSVLIEVGGVYKTYICFTLVFSVWQKLTNFTVIHNSKQITGLNEGIESPFLFFFLLFSN